MLTIPTRPLPATMTLRSRISVLDGLPRTSAADVDTTPGVVHYSIRAAQLVDVLDSLDGGRWMCRPLAAEHAASCRVVLEADDLTTALTPEQLDSTGHPDRISDRDRFLTAWRCRALEDHGQRAGVAADAIAARALPVHDDAGPSIVLLDQVGRRRLALDAHMHHAGFGRHVADLHTAGLLIPTNATGVPAAELSLPAATHRPVTGQAD